MLQIGLDVPISGTAHTIEEARQVAERIGRFPLIIRPGFTLSKWIGQKVIDKGIVEGLTAMAHDWDESAPGPISVQGDHGPVEIRKLTVTELVK